jgi:two-component system, NtrC family, response regulator HydG
MKNAKNFDESFLAELSQLRNDLFDAAVELSELWDTASIRDRLFEFIFKITSADRAAIFIDNSLWERRKTDPKLYAGTRNETIDRVLKNGEAVAESSPELSILAVPLVALRSRTIGAIYMESTNPEAPLNQLHRFLLTAAATLVANAFATSIQLEMLQAEVSRLRGALDIRHDLIGNSPAIQKLTDQISKVAPTNTTVLIQGESGTGKELVARAIHQNSKRKTGPFVAISCPAFPDHLLESELFGYDKGAFTGAVAQKKGYFETASGGTLFLDEIGDMPVALQPKLLRALQEGEIQRLGGVQSFRIDIRLITATNRDLEKASARNEFRPELYYRLNVAPIKIPALRQRPEDITELSHHFIEMYRQESGRIIRGVSPEALEILQKYHWPGNVRELQNVIQRAVVFGSTDTIVPDDLPENLLERGGPVPRYHEAVNAFKRSFIEQAYAQTDGDHKQVAVNLGLNFRSLYRLLENLNLSHLK